MGEKGKVLALLRIALGVLFLYSGLTKVTDPSWTAAGFIAGAKTFPELYKVFLSPEILPFVNLLNSYGQLLLGISLLTGLGLRISTILGSLLMLLYYTAGLRFPYAGAHSFIVDEHVIYILCLFLLRSYDAGSYFGLKNFVSSRFSFLKYLVR